MPPCPHFDVKIIQRSKRQSAVASAAYQSGERLFSEYDQKQKYYSHKSEIVHTEIMLPPHAPPEYADRNALWNAAEAIEKQWNSQLARRLVLAIPRDIVGPSGSGKTTLTSLMARFWDVDSGSVKLGGIDVKDYALDSLMSNFSMVFQAVYLFNDSIENNIKFGKPDATHEEVVAVAKAARCHDFIAALPKGYDTVIGEGGATLSGGERQRLSIARATVRRFFRRGWFSWKLNVPAVFPCG